MRLVVRAVIAILCGTLLVPGNPNMYTWAMAPEVAPQEQAAPTIPADQLDSLVAPIALYPDPLLAQVLAASTYPLEIIQLQQWLNEHRDLKDKALQDAVQKQNWDSSVQALASLPDALKQLADNVTWTTDLGNAFLAQQSDVMDAVQRMRKKAQDTGNLKSNQQQKVETETVENKQVIVVQQADPQVVYVPNYNPAVVYGPPAYPYPPIAYPPPGAYVAGAAISFGVGVALGAAFSGGWGWTCGWHGGNNNIVINNNFVRNSNINNINRGGNTWQHNPQHRGSAPYSNSSIASKYGGKTAGSSLSQRQAGARQNIGQERARGQQLGGPNRSAGGQGGSAGGGDRVGNRETAGTRGGAGGGGGGFGGGGGGFNGGAARSSGARGSASMGGGGMQRGGGRRR